MAGDIVPSDHELIRTARRSPGAAPTTSLQFSSDGSREPTRITGNIGLLLYVSHFLSTWNSRLFEFGAFLFLAAIYPQTLLPASVYAVVRALSAATLSPWVGRFIDRAERLRIVRLSILGQRIAVALSCVMLWVLVRYGGQHHSPLLSYGALIALSALACVEKLSAITNTICVEREWVVIIAGGDESSLRTLNSQMRRIDLFCKLVAPLLVAFIDSVSTSLAIIVTGSMTAGSIAVEYFTIARVYNTVPELRESKSTESATISTNTTSVNTQLRKALQTLQMYFRHRAFLPSFSLALLYLTVLSFGGQMTTFLLAIGVESSMIGILRGISAICELSATWIGPRVMEYMGPVRSGIWFINWQIFCVSIASICLWMDLNPMAATIGTVSAVIASRVGLWGFDLSAQIIVQEEVDAESRGAFSSLEFAFQNVFEMLSFASTIVFAKPSQFKWPATISSAAVATAGILYAAFVRARRGHLVHLSKCMERHSKPSAPFRRGGWQEVFQNDDEELQGAELDTMRAREDPYFSA